MTNPFSASKLHPAVWWMVGFSFAILAGSSGNLIVLGAILLACVFVILSCRETAPWSQSLRFYLILGALVVILRLVFRIVFNLESGGSEPWLRLPKLGLNLGVLGEFQFFGAVDKTSILAALTDGLRLAAIILSVGMANTLANPRKLLKSTPGALFEVATAISVAINLAPQLIESLQRVRKARMLRGRSDGLRALSGIVIPVLEDTIDRSMSLAASMDARGFGRTADQSALRTTWLRAISLVSVCCFAIGCYLMLATKPDLLSLGVVAIGLVCLVWAVKANSAKHLRTRYRPQPLCPADYVGLLLSALVTTAALLGWGV